MKHANQTRLDHQPATRRTRRDPLLAAQLKAYSQAAKLAKATGGKAPSITTFVTFKKA